jgi:hypothetical protein
MVIATLKRRDLSYGGLRGAKCLGIGEAIGEPQGKKGGIPGPSPSPISGSGSQVSARSQHQSARSMA